MIVVFLAVRALIAVSYLLVAVSDPGRAKDWALGYALLIALVATVDLVRGHRAS